MARKSYNLNVGITDVIEYLEGNYQPKDVVMIAAGMYSVAFSFISQAEKYVIRVTPKEDHLLRDLYVWQEYGDAINTPEIFIVKEFNDTGYCAISRFIDGTPLSSEGKLNERVSVNSTLQNSFAEKLLEISRVTTKGIGYGKFGKTGAGKYSSMSATYKSSWVKSRDEEFSKYVSKGLLDRGLFEEAQDALNVFATEAYEKRHLVHGDYQTANVIVKGNRVISVLDWGNASWGDFAQDIAWTSMHPPIIVDEKRMVEYYAENGMDMTRIDDRLKAAKIFTLIIWAFWSTGVGKHTWAKENQRSLRKLLISNL